MIFQEVMVLSHRRCSSREQTITQEECWQDSCLRLELGARFTQSWASSFPHDIGERALCPLQETLHERHRTIVYALQLSHLIDKLNTQGPFWFGFYLPSRSNSQYYPNVISSCQPEISSDVWIPTVSII